MARSTKEIYELMRAQKDNLLHLSAVISEIASYDDYIDQVNSNSKTADHNHWMYQFSYQANQLEMKMDEFRTEMEGYASGSEEIGTPPWWRKIVLEFQVFDELIVTSTGKRTYSQIDESKRIVTRVSVNRNDDKVAVIKVATDSGRLSEEEEASLKAYLNVRCPIGCSFSLINLDPDLLRVIGTVYYDPIVDVNQVKASVNSAIKSYITDIGFNGVIYVRALTDYIQKAYGVKDVSPIAISASSGSISDTTSQLYESKSGHFIEDPNVPYLSTIQFEPFGLGN